MFKKVLFLVIFGVSNFSALFAADRYNPFQSVATTPPSYVPASGSPIFFNGMILYPHHNEQMAINPEARARQTLERKFAISKKAHTVGDINESLGSLKAEAMDNMLARYDASIQASIAAELRRLEALRNSLHGADEGRMQKQTVRRTPLSAEPNKNRKNLFGAPK